MNSIQEIAELQVTIKSAALRQWGDGWLVSLAHAAEIKVPTLKTFFKRGKRWPPADRLGRIERVLGFQPGQLSAGRIPVEPHRCQFRELAAMIAENPAVRLAVVKMLQDSKAARAEAILAEAVK